MTGPRSSSRWVPPPGVVRRPPPRKTCPSTPVKQEQNIQSMVNLWSIPWLFNSRNDILVEYINNKI